MRPRKLCWAQVIVALQRKALMRVAGHGLNGSNNNRVSQVKVMAKDDEVKMSGTWLTLSDNDRKVLGCSDRDETIIEPRWLWQDTGEVKVMVTGHGWSWCHGNSAKVTSMWLCIKWHGAWLYGVHRTCADGCSFMWHQPCQRCKYTTLVDI